MEMLKEIQAAIREYVAAENILPDSERQSRLEQEIDAIVRRHAEARKVQCG
jgi:hypothetical protein